MDIRCCPQTTALRRNRRATKISKNYFVNHSKYLDKRSKNYERNNTHYHVDNNNYRSNNCCRNHVQKYSNRSLVLQSSDMCSAYTYKVKYSCGCKK
tara:strand:- start:2486 stop:2773 length:288 start_codon:yes stop_codon:yes gene_type:complete